MIINKTAQQGDTVKVHYRVDWKTALSLIPLSEGNLLSYDRFRRGNPGFEEAATGMAVGELKTFTIAPEQGYGPYKTISLWTCP